MKIMTRTRFVICTLTALLTACELEERGKSEVEDAAIAGNSGQRGDEVRYFNVEAEIYRTHDLTIELPIQESEFLQRLESMTIDYEIASRNGPLRYYEPRECTFQGQHSWHKAYLVEGAYDASAKIYTTYVFYAVEGGLITCGEMRKEYWSDSTLK